MSSKTSRIFYECKLCDYKCSKKSNFERHKMTAKHHNTYQILTKTSNFCEDSEKNLNNSNKFKCICGKEYKHKQSLFNHKIKCEYKGKEEENELNIEINKNKIEKVDEDKEKNLINILMEQNEKLLDTIKDQTEVINNLGKEVKHIGNNNVINSNNTNIIVMLNNEHKDALNLDEFVNSLTISLEDLNLTKDKGLVKGITNAFIKNLNKLDKNKRPLYCLGTKKDTIYVKDKENWEEDNKNLKIRKSINKVAFEQRKAIDKWTEANPEYLSLDKKQEEYLKLIKNTTQVLENTNDEDKIVRNIVNGIKK